VSEAAEGAREFKEAMLALYRVGVSEVWLSPQDFDRVKSSLFCPVRDDPEDAIVQAAGQFHWRRLP
jgi:hypothetical protein